MNLLDYTCANVGERELFLGYEEFKKISEQAKFAFVTANIVLQGTETSIAEPYRIQTVKAANGKTYSIAIMGLSKFNPAFQKSGPEGKNIVTVSPIDMAKKYVPEMQQKADIIVILAAMSKDETHLLAKEVPGINLILASYGGILSVAREVEGETEIVYAGNQGKRIAEIRLYMGDDKKVAEIMKQIHYLSPKYPDDPKLLELQNEAMKKVGEITRARRPQSASATTAPPVPEYVHGEGCKGCHEEQFNIWENSRHANSFMTLNEKGKAGDASCQRCHVTGFNKMNGFKNEVESAKLLNVQCEACHGPGSLHPEQVKSGYGRVTISVCVSCHTKEWSPRFNYYEYYPKIKH